MDSSKVFGPGAKLETDKLNIDSIIARLLEGKNGFWTSRTVRLINDKCSATAGSQANNFKGGKSRMQGRIQNVKFCFVVRGSRPGKNVQLTEPEIRGLCLKSREIFLSQPILLELEAPLKICGKIATLSAKFWLDFHPLVSL